jgi:chaperone required for assembly of F1-ATPase
MSDKRPQNPMEAAQRMARRELPRRFYKEASIAPHGNAFAVTLDGRVAKTPAGKPLLVPEEKLAAALAAEWQGQGEYIGPATMPLTRIVNAAIDRVAGEMDAVRADIVKHAGSDLLLYRAEGPPSLVEAQEKEWSPLVDWARHALGARFILAEGVVHVTQAPAGLAAIAGAVQPYDPLALAALHTITTLTGSAIIALAIGHGRLTGAEAWKAAHVDEDFQMSQWGKDELALERRDTRWKEMQAASLILAAESG